MQEIPCRRPISILQLLSSKLCCFMSNNALIDSGGAINLNNQENTSIRNTFFLRNMASADGGAIEISGGTVTIDNVTCIGNQVLGNGGCLDIYYVILTVNNSDISENVAEHLYGLGIRATHSRIQVGSLH